MGPGYFVIAIMGCADGSAACQPVATDPTRYESQATCAAATGDALARNSDLDFPTLTAECRAVQVKPAAERREQRSRPLVVPASARRG